jgi:aldose 1-epimerase
LRIDYRARSDADTIVNLTNHSYFNLAGRGTIAAHELRLLAERFLPVNNQLIPLGEERDVHATAFDFTALRPIAVGLASADPQLKVAGGYDHCFILASGADSDAAAELYEPVSGRLLEIFTTQPGIQLYTGNNLNGTIRGRGGWRYDRHGGLCLETEHFPDAPNRPNFPSALLRAGEPYHETTTYRFSVR